MPGEIDLDTDGGIATITIDNQEKRNALGPPELAKLIDAVEEAESDDSVRCLVLTGAGEKAFSAGFDITYHQRNYGDGPDVQEDEGDFGDLVSRIKAFDYPVIAMINGGTFGGSMYLIAGCDLRIAVDEAQFGITPAKLGMVYGGPAIHEIMLHVGPANVRELLYTGEFIDAQRAYEMGLLNDVVPRAELESRTYGMAETIANNAPLSLMGMKKITRTLMEKTNLTDAEKRWSEQLELEAKESTDHELAVKAFMEGETPQFVGQ